MSILLKNGKLVKTIKQKQNFNEIPKGCQIIDIKGKYVFPGIIDSHTHYHLKSPKITTADDFYSGTVSAAFGGVTTFIDYSDQMEGHSLVIAFRDTRRIKRIEKKQHNK